MTPQRFMAAAAIALLLVPGTTLAASHNQTTAAPSHTTGQPNQSCETTGTTPGNTATAPGSAFNPDGNAGTRYAGEAAELQKPSECIPVRCGVLKAAELTATKGRCAPVGTGPRASA